MSVEIDPAELGFRRPFTAELGEVLIIKNTNTAPIAFKVKTTAPKQYCVRPNSGRIEPDHSVTVTVLLQAMKQDPPLDFKCRDKFLVQAVSIATDKEFATVQDIWDSVDKSEILEKKIRVNFLPPEDAKSGPSAVTPVRQSLANGVEATPDAPPPAYASPREDAAGSHDAADFEETSPEVKHDVKSDPEDSSSFVSGTTGAAAKDTAVETLKSQLAQAEVTIAALREASIVSGLRQRKAAASSSGDAAAPSASAQLQEAVRHGTEGVPIRAVAILCLLSFLLAYFFF